MKLRQKSIDILICVLTINFIDESFFIFVFTLSSCIYMYYLHIFIYLARKVVLMKYASQVVKISKISFALKTKVKQRKKEMSYFILKSVHRTIIIVSLVFRA